MGHFDTRVRLALADGIVRQDRVGEVKGHSAWLVGPFEPLIRPML